MNKENATHMHNRILSYHKENIVLSFAPTWMNLEDTMINEINQAQTDKYPMFPLTYRN